MPSQFIYRVHNEAVQIARQRAFIRETIARARELLSAPAPDIFIGRKT